VPTAIGLEGLCAKHLLGTVEEVVDHASLSLSGEIAPDLEVEQVAEVRQLDRGCHQVVDLSFPQQEIQDHALDDVFLCVIPAGSSPVDLRVVAPDNCVNYPADLVEDLRPDPDREILLPELCQSHCAAPFRSFSRISS